MKLITSLFLLIPLVNLAQITISKNNFPSSGNEYNYSNTNALGIDLSVTGANVDWDYSQLNSNSYDSVLFVSVTSTPFAYQFFFNNFILYNSYKADYAIKGTDFQSPDPTNAVTISEVFNFHKKNNSSLQMVGFGANINGIPTSIKYDTIDQLYPLPLTFGTNDSTTAYYLINVPTLGAYGQHKKRKVEVDGWGSITTPYQHYAQCLRVKTTLYQRDTLKIDQPFSLPGVAFNRPKETRYEWFTNGISVPVFSVTTQGIVPSSAKYIDANTSFIEDNNSHFEFSVYPNPAKDVIQIDIPYETADVMITDLNGKIVYSDTYTSSNLDISFLGKGNYVITIKKGNNIASKLIQKL